MFSEGGRDLSRPEAKIHPPSKMEKPGPKRPGDGAGRTHDHPAGLGRKRPAGRRRHRVPFLPWDREGFRAYPDVPVPGDVDRRPRSPNIVRGEDASITKNPNGMIGGCNP